MVAVTSIHHAHSYKHLCVKQFLGVKGGDATLSKNPENLGSGHKVFHDFTRLVSQLEAKR